MVFLLSGLGSGLGDASAALDKFKAIAACLVPPERDDVTGRFTVTHTCMDNEKHLARVADQQFSFVLFWWTHLARTSQRENPVGGVHCPANPVLNNERESTVKDHPRICTQP